jgi:hypothetical protein
VENIVTQLGNLKAMEIIAFPDGRGPVVVVNHQEQGRYGFCYGQQRQNNKNSLTCVDLRCGELIMVFLNVKYIGSLLNFDLICIRTKLPVLT